MGLIVFHAPDQVPLDLEKIWPRPSSMLSMAELDVEGQESLSRLMQGVVRELRSDGALVAWHHNGDEPLYLFAEGGWERASSLEREMTEMATVAGNRAKRAPRSQWRVVADRPSTGVLNIGIPVDEGTVTVTMLFKQLDQTTRVRAGEAAARMLPLILPFFSVWISRARSTSRSDALAEAIDRSDVGVLLVNCEGHLTFANITAEALIERKDGLRRQGSMLAASKLADTLRLQALLEHVISREGQTGPAPVIALNRANGRPLIAAVFPAKAVSNGPLASAAIIYVFDPDQDLPSFLAPACRLYGLSPVETRLTCMIADGMSLADAAKTTRVRELTARSYLKQVFLKTGTKRQAELVALMLKSAVRTARGFPTKLI